jgi:hypothetical protein
VPKEKLHGYAVEEKREEGKGREVTPNSSYRRGLHNYREERGRKNR